MFTVINKKRCQFCRVWFFCYYMPVALLAKTILNCFVWNSRNIWNIFPLINFFVCPFIFGSYNVDFFLIWCRLLISMSSNNSIWKFYFCLMLWMLVYHQLLLICLKNELKLILFLFLNGIMNIYFINLSAITIMLP